MRRRSHTFPPEILPLFREMNFIPQTRGSFSEDVKPLSVRRTLHGAWLNNVTHKVLRTDKFFNVFRPIATLPIAGNTFQRRRAHSTDVAVSSWWENLRTLFTASFHTTFTAALETSFPSNYLYRGHLKRRLILRSV